MSYHVHISKSISNKLFQLFHQARDSKARDLKPAIEVVEKRKSWSVCDVDKN